ncbi:S-layer homology domain-containing protein [Rossellomorea sp. KS-H15a]|uniref:S-layer homology domain-containing protein n=1 Tax=Rossellomorea sp. KS-H15a TaxID=2963940 RepID=UPI0020C5D270|nr:S-layer homology domain-containing protein [Rossellomorea sp. KS-H15a]UTE77421.1 S-layer homology domain-containing protein [Rossellomorea sp. KS-H15a]
MKKIFFLSFIFMILGFCMGSSAGASGTFTDVTLYEKEINYLANSKIVEGYGDTFKPNDPVRRIQAVQMILRDKGIKDMKDVKDPGFTDLKKGDYGYEEVAKAVEMGWVSGKTREDGSKYFDPWGSLTRAQMTKIIVQAYNLSGYHFSDFTDVPKSHWAYNYINVMVKNRIVTGFNDHSFHPQEVISRQHFAVMLARTIKDTFRMNDVAIDYKDNEVFFNGITLLMTKEEVIQKLGLPDASSPSQSSSGFSYSYRTSDIFKDDRLAVFFFESGDVRAIHYETKTFYPLNHSVDDEFVHHFSGEVYGEIDDYTEPDQWLHYYIMPGSKHVLMSESVPTYRGDVYNTFKLGLQYEGAPIETDETMKKLTKDEVIRDYTK